MGQDFFDTAYRITTERRILKVLRARKCASSSVHAYISAMPIALPEINLRPRREA